jgi:hypothetical protein
MNRSSWLSSLTSRVLSLAAGALTLSAASDAFAAAEGEHCGRAGGWSSTCDDGLACDVEWSFWIWHVGVCTTPQVSDDECLTDEDCPYGYCDAGVTCAAIGCPPPPPNQCTACGDGSELRCKRALPECPDGLVPEIVDSCYGECVDRYTCEARAAGTCDYNGVTYQVGERFKSADGCNDCNCNDGGLVACTLRLCLCDFSDPARSWVSKDPEECTRIDYLCAPGTQPFTDQACGCGCEPAPQG